MRLVLPRLYVILDAALLKIPAKECAKSLVDAGARLIQYRNKRASGRELFETSRELAEYLNPIGVHFIVNDRADVAALVRAGGVHVGQDDLGVEQAREVIGDGKWLGVSTHNAGQFRVALETSADYIAVGPVFATGSKQNPDPVVGVGFVRETRAMTDRPIVAIGGITLERAAEVIEAGADSVAIISDILRAENVGKRAGQYVDLLEQRGS
ncbi:MAG TPA: thiamine phosphate synthase [Verrucomicrobiae bacterium]|jgi:thiamine-phosphate pyrophosphorylase|nr:thiamine phosphate synthase [Verrucomicrobiae bacterium]